MASLTLSALTAALKRSSPEEFLEFAKTFQALLTEHDSEVDAIVASMKKGKKKAPTSNPSGPAEWNAFVRATWEEMAAAKGVSFDGDEKKFKAEAKKAGASYQAAFQEASRRKALAEGRDPEAEAAARHAKNTARKEKKSAADAASDSSSVSSAAAGPAAPAPAKKAAPEPEPEAEEDAADAEARRAAKKAKKVAKKRAAALLELELVLKNVDGELYAINEETGDAYFLAEDGAEEPHGERAGLYDAELDIIDPDA